MKKILLIAALIALPATYFLAKNMGKVNHENKLYVMTYGQLVKSDMKKSVVYFIEKTGLTMDQIIKLVHKEGRAKT